MPNGYRVGLTGVYAVWLAAVLGLYPVPLVRGDQAAAQRVVVELSVEICPPTSKLDPLIPAEAGVQGRELGPRFRGDERK